MKKRVQLVLSILILYQVGYLSGQANPQTQPSSAASGQSRFKVSSGFVVESAATGSKIF